MVARIAVTLPPVTTRDRIVSSLVTDPRPGSHPFCDHRRPLRPDLRTMATRPPGKTGFRIPVSKPRNPLAAAAKKRVAGPHRKSEGALRAAERTALQRALDKKTD